MVDVVIAPEHTLPADSVIGRIMAEIAARPEIREPLLRALLTEDFLTLPILVKEQGERIDDLTTEMRAGFQRLDDRIDGVRDELGHRIDGVRDELKDEIRDLRGETMKVSREIGTLRGRVGHLFGQGYEEECREQIDAILIHHLDNPTLVDRARFRDDMQAIRVRGIISRNEYQQVRAIDIVASDAADDGTIVKYGVVEVSYTVNNDDIDKAATRRAIVQRATGVSTDAFFITNNAWPETLSEYAAGKGVTVIRYESKYDDAW